jgi:hypothetical protein
MSNEQGPTIETRVAELERVERAILDRVDRTNERITRLEVKMDQRFTDLERKMEKRFMGIEENQRVMTQMLTEILTRLPGWPPNDQQEPR